MYSCFTYNFAIRCFLIKLTFHLHIICYETLAPFQDSKYVIRFVFYNLSIDMKTGEMKIGGFGDLKMDYIRVVRHFGLKDIKVSLRFGGNLKITGNYTLKGQAIGILPVTGDGDFTIAINGAEISAITYAVMNQKGKNEAEKKKLIVKNLDAQVGYKELDFKFENLMGGGIVGSTVNLVINAMGEGIIESQRQMLISILKNQFHNYVTSWL